MKKCEKISIFRGNYDRTLTIEENVKLLKNVGLNLSIATCSRWIKKYIGVISIDVPVCYEKEVKEFIKKLKGE